MDIDRLRDALAELSEPQRQALLLREWQGLSYREIAERMDRSVANVEALIFRARRALSAVLEDDSSRNQRAGLAGVIGFLDLLGHWKALAASVAPAKAVGAGVLAGALAATGTYGVDQAVKSRQQAVPAAGARVDAAASRAERSVEVSVLASARAESQGTKPSAAATGGATGGAARPVAQGLEQVDETALAATSRPLPRPAPSVPDGRPDRGDNRDGDTKVGTGDAAPEEYSPAGTISDGLDTVTGLAADPVDQTVALVDETVAAVEDTVAGVDEMVAAVGDTVVPVDETIEQLTDTATLPALAVAPVQAGTDDVDLNDLVGTVVGALP